MPRGRVERFPDLREFVKKTASADRTRNEVLQMAREEIGDGVTYDMLRRLYRIDKLPFYPAWKKKAIIPDDKADAFIELIRGRSSMDVQKLAKEQLGLDLTLSQIRGWKKNHKTVSGYDTRFRSGRIPETRGRCWNEFMSPEAQERSKTHQFKKGHIPKNRKPLGEVFLRSDGYLWIKTQDGAHNKNWKQYHRYIWEKEHGPVPKDYKILFLNGNTQDCRIENLIAVSESVLAVANTVYQLTTDPELNKVILKAAELKVAMTKAQERRKK